MSPFISRRPCFTRSRLFTAILATIAEVTKLEDRPLLFGSFGGVFAVASAVGPILGGALTDHLSWR